MRPLEILAVYLLLGLAISVASARAGRPSAWMCVPLWPLFLPGLLAEQSPALEAAASRPARVEAAISSLRAALLAWNGLPDPEGCHRAVEGLGQGLAELAARVAQIEAIIAADRPPEVSADLAAGWAVQHGRLVSLAAESRAALERGIGGAAELAARVHLARLSGEPAASVLGALSQLRAAVEAGQELAVIRSAKV